MIHSHRRIVLSVLAASVMAWGSAAFAGGLLGLSKPSQDVTLQCSRPGQIATIEVADGEPVKAGQEVVHEDNREEKTILDAKQAKAEDDTRVNAQIALWEQSKVDRDRLEYAFTQGAAGKFERDKARIDVVVAAAQIEIEKANKKQAQLEYEQAKVVVDKLVLRAPFDGVVQKRFVSPAESVELNTKVIQIVKIDPMWVEVDVPRSQARDLKKDSLGQVAFSDKSTATGKIVFIAPVANSASSTFLVRLEVANPESRQPGEQVMVDFSATKVANADK